MFRLDEKCFEEPFRFSKRDMRRFSEARRARVCLADWKAEEGSVLAGFSIVHVERTGLETAGYLLTLDVDPAFRRRGLALRLLQQSERDAAGAGCSAMLLHVFVENSGAVALYERLHYERLRIVENFYGAGLHAWVYRKRLAATSPA